MTRYSRREAMAIGAAGLAGGVLALAGCAQSSSGGGKSTRVVVYSSIDREIIEPVLAEFNRASAAAAVGGGVAFTAELVGDTEATKTTGLAQRVLSERARPRADIWLSSEGVTTAWLAREGVLAELRSPAQSPPTPGLTTDADALGRAIDAWPAEFRTKSAVAMALRPRRIVYNTRVMGAERAPRSIEELCRDDLRGRVVIARARFGTTRGHVAVLHTRLGDEGLLALAKRLKDAGVREVDGNASVVRIVARGEAHAGLTDSDDVYAGQREGWPVDSTADP
ncbi:MAG: ABC transporter substrate-binding protein, partial [Phycisphaerales bacterium]|nr:ABC transporter substrate-binding protein [Phycisphaerales bacterium]